MSSAWRIEYSATALNQLRKLDHGVARRVVRSVERHVNGIEGPRSSGSALSGPLGGLWRYRVGDYRVICEIRDATIQVLVLRLGHRRDIYR